MLKKKPTENAKGDKCNWLKIKKKSGRTESNCRHQLGRMG